MVAANLDVGRSGATPAAAPRPCRPRLARDRPPRRRAARPGTARVTALPALRSARGRGDRRRSARAGRLRGRRDRRAAAARRRRRSRPSSPRAARARRSASSARGSRWRRSRAARSRPGALRRCRGVNDDRADDLARSRAGETRGGAAPGAAARNSWSSRSADLPGERRAATGRRPRPRRGPRRGARRRRYARPRLRTTSRPIRSTTTMPSGVCSKAPTNQCCIASALATWSSASRWTRSAASAIPSAGAAVRAARAALSSRLRPTAMTTAMIRAAATITPTTTKSPTVIDHRAGGLRREGPSTKLPGSERAGTVVARAISVGAARRGVLSSLRSGGPERRRVRAAAQRSPRRPAQRADKRELVGQCESLGDELTREILRRLNSSFVTPFDREDIHELTEEIDDVVDDMQAAADLLVLHHVKRAAAGDERAGRSPRRGRGGERRADREAAAIARPRTRPRSVSTSWRPRPITSIDVRSHTSSPESSTRSTSSS